MFYLGIGVISGYIGISLSRGDYHTAIMTGIGLSLILFGKKR